MARFVRWLLLSVLIFTSLPGVAEIYRYVDEQGNIVFTDEPVEDRESTRIEVQVNSYSSPSVAAFNYDPSLITRRPDAIEVVMYSAAWCGYCKQARRYFRAQKIPFTEYDVEKSERGRRDYKALKGRGVPIILAGEKRMNGFSVDAFERIYRR